MNTISLQLEVDLSAKIDELAQELRSIAALVDAPGNAGTPRKADANVRKPAKRHGGRQKPALSHDVDVFDPDRCNFPALIGLLDEVTQTAAPVKARRARL
jgi:hypothetical protein